MGRKPKLDFYESYNFMTLKEPYIEALMAAKALHLAHKARSKAEKQWKKTSKRVVKSDKALDKADSLISKRHKAFKKAEIRENTQAKSVQTAKDNLEKIRAPLGRAKEEQGKALSQLAADQAAVNEAAREYKDAIAAAQPRPLYPVEDGVQKYGEASQEAKDTLANAQRRLMEAEGALGKSEKRKANADKIVSKIEKAIGKAQKKVNKEVGKFQKAKKAVKRARDARTRAKEDWPKKKVALGKALDKNKTAQDNYEQKAEAVQAPSKRLETADAVLNEASKDVLGQGNFKGQSNFTARQTALALCKFLKSVNVTKKHSAISPRKQQRVSSQTAQQSHNRSHSQVTINGQSYSQQGGGNFRVEQRNGMTYVNGESQQARPINNGQSAAHTAVGKNPYEGTRERTINQVNQLRDKQEGAVAQGKSQTSAGKIEATYRDSRTRLIDSVNNAEEKQVQQKQESSEHRMPSRK